MGFEEFSIASNGELCPVESFMFVFSFDEADPCKLYGEWFFVCDLIPDELGFMLIAAFELAKGDVREAFF